MLLATLLRLAFPSWAFFDRVGTPPRLEVRPASPDGTPGPWRPAIVAAPRRWWHVAWHPAGTRTLAAQVLVERWHAALVAGDRDDASARLDAMAHALARACVAGDARPAGAWSYRLVESHGAATHVVHEVHVPAAGAESAAPHASAA